MRSGLGTSPTSSFFDSWPGEAMRMHVLEMLCGGLFRSVDGKARAGLIGLSAVLYFVFGSKPM
jgi:hypothetical protein